MAHFYFKLHGEDRSEVTGEAELADFADARAFALKAARSLAAYSVVGGTLTLNDHVSIEDEDHHLLGVVRFGEAVHIKQ